MTATIELSDRLVQQAEKLSGINDVQALISMSVKNYVDGEKFMRAGLKAQAAANGENPFWEGYDPKA